VTTKQPQAPGAAVSASPSANVPELIAQARAGRWLERALLFSLVVHGVASLGSAFLLLPGTPGVPADAAARMAYVASHAWLWRLGWVPWHFAALANLLLAVALLRSRFVARVPAVLALVFTVLAVLPDQGGQIAWDTRGVALARAGNVADYLAFEQQVFAAIGGWASIGYTLVGLCWSWCFLSAGLWRRWLTWYSLVLWGLFLCVSIAPLVPALRAVPGMVTVGTAVALALLLLWLAVVLELALRRSRPETPRGRYAPWRHPGRMLGRGADLLANSRVARRLCEFLPVLAFRSDITEVLYINYLVEASTLEPLAPPGLELQRLGKDGRYALFTFLTYRHGHFGPRLLGPLRRVLMPSPIQSNWRVYVTDPGSGRRGVYFVSTAVSSTLVGVLGRLMAEGMPQHVFQHARLWSNGEGVFYLRLHPGAGTAPDAEALLHLSKARPTSGAWSLCFESYAAMLAYVVPQDRAFSVQPWHARLTRQEIQLGIPLEACEPLEGDVNSAAARALVGAGTPFCFRVPRVAFRFDEEAQERLE
jgi:hypothetical protein